MRLIAKYVHGSEDSLDTDVLYVVDQLPSFQECQQLCANKEENVNLVVIENGIVVDCFKGAPDEVNNGLYYTYRLHPQAYPLSVNRVVERDMMMKHIRATRGILSILSRTKYRDQIKNALRHGWTSRLDVLRAIVLDQSILPLKHKIDYDDRDLLKVITFQIGQGMGLLDGKELYTKRSIAKAYPKLAAYVDRRTMDLTDLNDMLHEYVERLTQLHIEEDGTLLKYENKIYDVKNETHL